jgi:hypothetical protein
MRMIIGRSLTPLNYSRTSRALRRRETVRRSDDNSRRKVQNVRGDSSAVRNGVRPPVCCLSTPEAHHLDQRDAQLT